MQSTKPINWRYEDGIGHLTPTKSPYHSIYGEAYFQEYVKRANTKVGKKITETRIDFVARALSVAKDAILDKEDHPGWPVNILDVGAGACQFVEEADKHSWIECYGTDINPYSIERLKELGAYQTSPTSHDIVTFWDVFEHLEFPYKTVSNYSPLLVCMTIPLFQSERDMLKSKHYKPNEHIWYFTASGLVRMMRQMGYEALWDKPDLMEVNLGREQVGSFAFIKVKGLS